MIMTDANPWLFLTRPISGTLLVLALLSFVLAIYQEQRYLRKKQSAGQSPARADIDVEEDF